MRTIYIAIVFLFSILAVNPVKAQQYSVNSKKAILLYEDAVRKMDIRSYGQAIDLLEMAVNAESQFVEAWLLMADAYTYLYDYSNAIMASKKAIAIAPQKNPIAYFMHSYASFNIGQYQDALENALLFLELKRYTINQKIEIERIVKNSKFAINAIANPVEYDPVRLGDEVNSVYNEYWPSLSADEKILTFTRLLPKDPNNPNPYRNRQEDIFFSVFENNKWQEAQPIGEPVNTPENEGAQFITPDGLQMFFTACNRMGGKGKCDIFYAIKKEQGWTEPINLGEPVNSSHSEKQPTLSSDGRTLYFASDRPGGKGAFDIWVSVLGENGKWSEPKNLGDSINTPYDEQSPFIHPDGQSLYFASDGHVGMGGYDVYLSRKINDVDWSEPINLGYPANTFADEIGLIVDATGRHAYFSSDRIPEKGRDIYLFNMPPNVTPVEVSYIKGKIYDAENSKPLQASFELIDLATSQIVTASSSSQYTGEFLLCLPANNDYALNVSKQGYMFYSDNIRLSVRTEKKKPLIKDIALEPIKPGKTVVLKNIFYETGSFDLQRESEAELSKLNQFLTKNKDVIIEISGHTDNTGSDELNRKLSENRARVVVEHLIKKGIEKNRLIYKGYGKNQPVADNSTEEGRALNRRTEFKIIQ